MTTSIKNLIRGDNCGKWKKHPTFGKGKLRPTQRNWTFSSDTVQLFLHHCLIIQPLRLLSARFVSTVLCQLEQNYKSTFRLERK